MLLEMDYISNLTMSSGSDTLSGSVGCSGISSGGISSGRHVSRVRTVRLVRPCTGTLPPPGLTCRHGPGLGFSIRGGREHGTGFFVSSVEPGSEAHRQGLKIGDQIIRVNGFIVEDAVHKEVLQLISNHTHLTLKVRSVGMIPVKDKCTDPLSWHIISDYVPIISESPPLEEKHHDVRINIAVAQRAKLGCGICKGPEWKPGIFVQFTKEGGIARDAGLRPGDQILYCNNIDFIDISFNEAVNVMKMSRQLDLIVRKGAGSELFPGESSGYNSSASSVTGDQSPSWSDSKRLSIVKEESLELEDRLSHLEYGRYKPKNWEKISYDWDDNPHHFKPTIINLSENGTTIKNNGNVEGCQNNLEEADNEKDIQTTTKLADICLVSHQHETKTVVVEVHRSDLEEVPKLEENLKKSPSNASFSSLSSRNSIASSSLSSAISLELQRRTERNKEVQKKINIEEELQKNKILKNVDSEKKHQHDKLMDEFRKAHRKMFNNPNEKLQTEQPEKSNTEAKEVLVKDRHSQISLAQQISEQRRISNGSSISEEVNNEKVTTPTAATTLQNSTSGTATTGAPPPPPPMPSLSDDPKPKSTKPKAPPVPLKTYQQPLPPPCPTPDYDSLSISSGVSHTLPRPAKSSNGTASPLSQNGVDMDSLESFKLNNPMSPHPKPPSTYFNKQKLSAQSSLGSSVSHNSTLQRKPRPVSITIGEYPSGTNRRQPHKLEFLANADSNDSAKNEPITSRLASELAQTLSRSNLRKRNDRENAENMLNGGPIKPQTNGSVTIAVNNTSTPKTTSYNSQSHKLLTKSQSSDFARNSAAVVDSLSSILGNRVTIKISDNDSLKADVPSSILKNAQP